LFSIIQAAGWPIWPLLICSVAALALIIERFVALRRVRIAPAGLAKEVIKVCRNGAPSPEVIDKLATNSLLGQVLAAGLRQAARSTQAEALRQAFESAGRAAAHQLERYLNALATIATAAPLLGLLGTVIGMIEIFGTQAPGSGGTNPAQLAHGISVALYNTAFGLMVAIPTLVAQRYFRGCANGFLHDLEQDAEQLLHCLLHPQAAAPAVTEPASTPPAPAAAKAS
jgi:biopolymer transport protein ExbB